MAFGMEMFEAMRGVQQRLRMGRSAYIAVEDESGFQMS